MKTTLLTLCFLLLCISTDLKCQSRRSKNKPNQTTTKILNQKVTLEYLIHLKTTSTFSGVSKALLSKGFYFKDKNDIYSSFTNGTDEVYYFQGQENDGSGIIYGNAKEIKEKIAVQYMFNSKNLYDELVKQSYNYLGAELYKQHTEANGNIVTVIKSSDFVFLFGENLEKTDDLNYKVFIMSKSNFIE